MNLTPKKTGRASGEFQDVFLAVGRANDSLGVWPPRQELPGVKELGITKTPCIQAFSKPQLRRYPFNFMAFVPVPFSSGPVCCSDWFSLAFNG